MVQQFQGTAMALRAAYLYMHRQTNAWLSEKITADQFVCLILLDEKEAISQTELAKRATSDPNTIRAILLILEKRGLIRRDPHPTDKRQKLVTITAKGSRLRVQLELDVKPVGEKLKSAFSPEEEKLLNLLLIRVAESMKSI